MKEYPYFNSALLPLAVLRQVCLWSDWAAEQAGLATDVSLLPEQILIGCQCQTSSPAHFPSQPGAASLCSCHTSHGTRDPCFCKAEDFDILKITSLKHNNKFGFSLNILYYSLQKAFPATIIPKDWIVL